MCSVRYAFPGSAICSIRAAEADRVTKRRVVHAQIVADLADDHFPGVQPHSHREADSLRETQLVRVAAQIVAVDASAA